jgi:hypothetical protein
VIPHLGNASLFKNNDPVGPSKRGDPVGDEKNRLALHGSLHPFKNLFFRLDIDGGEGIVKNENGRVHQHSPGNGYPLPLSSGKGNPLFPDHCIETLRELQNFIVDLGTLCRFNDLLLCRIKSPECDVLPDRI